jgi:GntR family transcriptional regulator/MocR family aminotransferase
MHADRHRSLSKSVKLDESAAAWARQDDDLPLHEKVYRRLRWLILTGAWPCGSKLPASRMLSSQLAVSRNTVLSALDRLLADAWVEARKGSGVYVTYAGPQLQEPVTAVGAMQWSYPLAPRAHAIDLFPKRLWNKLQSRRWKHLSSAGLALGDPLGWQPLREVIAAHVAIMRNVECGPQNIVVTTGVPAAIDLVSRVLNLSGGEAWIEDPGYDVFMQSLSNSGVRAVPIRVDQSGIDVSQGVRAAPRAKLVVVTPTCQFPTCAVLTDSRRAGLLAWASATDAWIVDDDYDWQSTDWRKGPKPLAAMDKLHTIYVNSFNPILFPALRIAFAVIPSALVDRFAALRVGLDQHANGPNQMILADFMNSGHFDDHLRRLAEAYPERRSTLVKSLEDELSGVVTPYPTHIGTQVVARLDIHDEQTFVNLCAREKIAVRGMSNFRAAASETREVLFGFAGFVPAKITAAVRTIRKALKSV